MNRTSSYWDPQDLPQPSGQFSDDEALEILIDYRRDPSSIPCPTCGPDQIEVLAFIEVRVSSSELPHMTDPEGEYAAAVYCHTCTRAIGIVAGRLED